MKCSTVIPTIGRDTLCRSIQSALEQDLADCEVIVVNDSGAPLNLGLYADCDRVKVIDTNRSGLCFACNAGVAAARGEYIKFLHDDDYLHGGALRALVDEAEATHCRWILGSARIVDENGKSIYDLDSSPVGGNILGELLVGESTHMSYCLIHRETFLEVGGFDPQMRLYEDRDLCWRIALRHDVGSVKDVVACVRASGAPGSAYSFAQIATYHRMIRERILNEAEAQPRLRASVQGRAIIRGRACRQGLFSAIINLRACPLTALDRLLWTLRVASWHVVEPQFWRGLFYKT